MTPEQIAAATPDSITTTDNAIYQVSKDLNCLIKSDAFGDDFVVIPADTLVRILDCDLDSSGFTMVRYKEHDLSICNKYLIYVSGDTGTRVG